MNRPVNAVSRPRSPTTYWKPLRELHVKAAESRRSKMLRFLGHDHVRGSGGRLQRPKTGRQGDDPAAGVVVSPPPPLRTPPPPPPPPLPPPHPPSLPPPNLAVALSPTHAANHEPPPHPHHPTPLHRSLADRFTFHSLGLGRKAPSEPRSEAVAEGGMERIKGVFVAGLQERFGKQVPVLSNLVGLISDTHGLIRPEALDALRRLGTSSFIAETSEI